MKLILDQWPPSNFQIKAKFKETMGHLADEALLIPDAVHRTGILNCIKEYNQRMDDELDRDEMFRMSQLIGVMREAITIARFGFDSPQTRNLLNRRQNDELEREVWKAYS
jgi:hypothetical protein